MTELKKGERKREKAEEDVFFGLCLELSLCPSPNGNFRSSSLPFTHTTPLLGESSKWGKNGKVLVLKCFQMFHSHKHLLVLTLHPITTPSI